MLDLQYLRDNSDRVKKSMEDRGIESDVVDDFLEHDERRREILQEVEELRRKRNVVSEKIGELKQSGEDVQPMIEEMRSVSDRIDEYEEELKEVEEKQRYARLHIPNVPDESVPVGEDESDNEFVRSWGEPPEFDFDFKPHWEIGEDLDILDFERGSKVAGSRFTFMKGAGAQLERALINFMIDYHRENHGYYELFPPFLANSDSMTGTGQLPKFEFDMFKVKDYDNYLIPTAEVPVTNFHREEILDADDLPLYYTAYSACFRAEAGSHGRDTRGIVRQHQFNKVELVKFVEPETSYEELETLTDNAEAILQALELPYRVVKLCTGDLTFSSALTYDLEIWMPAYERYREISSCSNFEDYQARRAGIQYRPDPDSQARYVHTLNGSGVAIGRTLAAILENYQNEDGTVTIPEVLRDYMGGREIIE
ncbi:serine--tRNA ligase [Halarsenatibacter silvermanii]|uniref:Serine--tRNA ligase n=1 Tax=Halarsenatibacter silvermanii TaxID=321763 RepID=A0A1G9QSI1_9FIRM|nr:serine--tRNA ligase [Halarsenatibacter silvermanii]SDM13956.1 seryl-tRNA synthetase [Halarsenatibacter silvermanii]